MIEPESMPMQAARRLIGELLVHYPERYAARAVEIIATLLPPTLPTSELELSLRSSRYGPSSWVVNRKGSPQAIVADFGPNGEQAARAWLSDAPAERPQVVVILEGGTVSSAHSNIPGLDLGIIDCDDEEEYRRRLAAGQKDALDEEVYETMQQHRAQLAVGKLPHQVY
ncbi:MAG: hypothetical protein AMXMBFR7_26340 [Planctomycetota bacterium]